ncbi:hypothetical protein [Bacillus xiapuensis]|uniref:hypothetical protein n=1 Tax=Bacillus xiapuensis TaxID=2014075 RepID=UPI000C24EB03
MGAMIAETVIPLFTAIVLSSTSIAIGEWFFHMYLAKTFCPEKDPASIGDVK